MLEPILYYINRGNNGSIGSGVQVFLRCQHHTFHKVFRRQGLLQSCHHQAAEEKAAEEKADEGGHYLFVDVPTHIARQMQNLHVCCNYSRSDRENHMYDSADVIETGQTMKLENQELRKEIVAMKKERDMLKTQLTSLEMEYQELKKEDIITFWK